MLVQEHQFGALCFGDLMSVEATEEDLCGVEIVQGLRGVALFECLLGAAEVSGIEDFELGIGDECVEAVVQVADEVVRVVDDLEPGDGAFSGEFFDSIFDLVPVTGDTFEPLKGRDGDLSDMRGGGFGFEADEHDALLLVCLAEAHRDGGTAVADPIAAADDLGDMQVAERDIVEGRREDGRAHMRQGADVELAHTVTLDGLAAGGEEVAGSDDGEVSVGLGSEVFGGIGDLFVVIADAIQEVLFLILNGFARLCAADIAVAEEGDRADDQFRSAAGAMQQEDLIGRVGACASDDVDIESAEQFLGRVEERGRIVIPGDDHGVAAWRCREASEETVIELLRACAGGGGIEDVAGDDEHFDRLVLDEPEEPVEKAANSSYRLRVKSARPRCQSDVCRIFMDEWVELYHDLSSGLKLYTDFGWERQGWRGGSGLALGSLRPAASSGVGGPVGGARVKG